MNDMNIEKRTMRKIHLRILPLLAMAFLFSWLDKVNIGFAALQMNADLGFSNTIFGLAAGIFSIGYMLFVLPGTLIMQRVGARQWISLALIASGIFSMATAFVTKVEEILIVRALLGMAEASLAPTMFVFLGLWFPNEYRGRAVSILLLVSPIALIIGGPASTALLAMDGILSLAGWQWLFIIEALPTIIVAVAIFFLLRNKPDETRWLAPAEKKWLHDRLVSERCSVTSVPKSAASARHAFGSRRLWTLAFVNFGFGIVGPGPLFFMPLVVKSMGLSTMSTGLLVTLPAILGGISLPFWGKWADRARKRETVLAAAGCMIAIGFLVTAALLPSLWAIAGLSLVMIGLYGSSVSSALLPYSFLSGTAVAVGIAVMNTAISIGGFGGSLLVGRLSDLTGSYATALTWLGLIALAVAVLLVMHMIFDRKRSPDNGAPQAIAS